jgi:hypothetical protein
VPAPLNSNTPIEGRQGKAGRNNADAVYVSDGRNRGRELQAGHFRYIPGSPSTRHSLNPHHGVTSGQALLRSTPHDENISTLGPPQSDEKDVCIPKN